MRQVTQKIVSAFLRTEYRRVGNTWTDGRSIWLFGNKIAEFRNDGLWITNAGWPSPTTKERLNGIPDVSIVQRRGTWFLNGREWNGGWVNLGSWNDGIEYVDGEPVVQDNEPDFDLSSVWVPEGGYSKPIYSVWHSNDLGTLVPIEISLMALGVPFRRWESDTDGVYRPNYFVVVRPEDFNRVLTTINQ
jgi:hypothetical protein